VSLIPPSYTKEEYAKTILDIAMGNCNCSYYDRKYCSGKLLRRQRVKGKKGSILKWEYCNCFCHAGWVHRQARRRNAFKRLQKIRLKKRGQDNV
jgi:hypothetical protein